LQEAPFFSVHVIFYNKKQEFITFSELITMIHLHLNKHPQAGPEAASCLLADSSIFRIANTDQMAGLCNKTDVSSTHFHSYTTNHRTPSSGPGILPPISPLSVLFHSPRPSKCFPRLPHPNLGRIKPAERIKASLCLIEWCKGEKVILHSFWVQRTLLHVPLSEPNRWVASSHSQDIRRRRSFELSNVRESQICHFP
jgi:hypothetical protein